ncbi:MAG: DUF302 domain-containing protein [Steroidobacterales bacterium]
MSRIAASGASADITDAAARIANCGRCLGPTVSWSLRYAARLAGAHAEASTMADDGLVSIASSYSVKESLDRLEVELRAKSITVFARIDHAAGAASVAMTLRPTELLIFGNPKAGTPLMQSTQTIGIDLPLKILGWQDEGGKVWLCYTDPRRLARRHGLSSATTASVVAMTTLLASLASAAAQ